MAIADQEFRKIAEAVAVLAGWRGDKNRSALLRGELSTLQDYIAKVTNSATQLQNKIETVNSELETAKQDLTDLGDSLATAESDISAVQDLLTAAQDQLTDLQSLLDAAQLQIDAIAAGTDTAQQDIDDLKAAAGAVSIPTPAQPDVTLAPTAADFNGAMADIRAIATALSSLKSAVS